MNGPDLHPNPLDSLLAATADSGRYLPGAITALSGDVVEGWAFEPANPELRLVVEVYVDGTYVGLTRADQEQPHGAPGDGFHGFNFQIRSEWLEKAKRVSARIANQGPWLADSIILPEAITNDATAKPAPHIGSSIVHYGGGLRINGWAFEPASPGKVIEIRIREGDTVFGIIEADRPTPGLVYAHSAEHGFEFDLPWHLADGQPHIIHVETEAGDPLAGSPLTVCVRPEGLAHLLQTQLPSKMPDPTRELLIALAEQHARRFPASCGFEHYAAWVKAFQQPLPLTPATQPTGRVTVLLLDEPNVSLTSRADCERSLESIQAQRLPSAQISVFSPSQDNLLSTLREAAKRADLVVPLRMGDRLPPHAVDSLLTAFNNDPKATWGYADCDQETDLDGRSNPWLKPAWDATLFKSIDLVTPGGAFTARALQDAARGLKPNSGWKELLQAVVAQTQDSQHVLHLPQVLYHRSARAEALPTRRQASWPPPKAWPRVSLIVPTRDQLHYLKPCVDGLLNGTDYPALEIIVVDNDSHEPETLAYLAGLQQAGVKVLRYPHAFNYAAINNWAVEHASGEVIGLINNDIAVQEPGWLKAMVTQLLRPSVGAVGAKLLWPNGMVQHGGVVVGINQLAGHAGNTLHKDDPGYLGLNLVVREQSAVTAACLLVAKADYQALGGMNADRYPVAFNDVDFCLRLRESGKKIVWTPEAVLTHAESASRGREDIPSKQARAQREQRNFIADWAHKIPIDPYHHPALSRDHNDNPYGALACPPAPLTPRL